MIPMRRFDRVLTDLDRLSAKLDKACQLHLNLNGKLAVERSRRAIQTARRDLRLMYYEVEDAFRPLDDVTDRRDGGEQ